MSKQEEIREGLMTRGPCPDDPSDCGVEGCNTCEWKINTVNEMLSYLHSKGCVLKVERELPEEGLWMPEPPVYHTDYGIFLRPCVVKTLMDLSVEPLIEEVTK